MSRNRRKNPEPVRVSMMALVGCAVAILMVFGLCFVYIKHQMVALGEQKSHKEEQLQRLKTENDALNARIAAMTSRAALRDQLTQRLADLQPIGGEQLVRLDSNFDPVHEESETLLPVAHERVSSQ